MVKYKNRKIYCTDENRYVSTQRAAFICAQNPHIKIISHETKLDVTNEVLYSAVDQLNRALLRQAKREELSQLLIETKEASDVLLKGLQ